MNEPITGTSSGADTAQLHCWWAWARDETSRRIFRFSVRYEEREGQHDVVSKLTLERLQSPGGDPELREQIEHAAFKEVERAKPRLPPGTAEQLQERWKASPEYSGAINRGVEAPYPP